MSEISLKEYFVTLDHLLGTGAADEVIHHCRHILQYFPKNVTAYRYLGRALVVNGRWTEGREALRRVLSVIPDDFTAHLGLSEANERINQPDEAIWHLERALEQRPNDKELIEGLRGLYRRYRSVDNLKVQLTSPAVARQYLRSGSYNQAIDALRSALARTKERLDLKLLLAQTLWEHGAQEEAAELALEVLKVLPDCLEANRIMARLWLQENRPSDARRYVNRLEGVDPYLAVEVVQGTAPDDDVFRLVELDYTRASQSELTGGRPDWLQEISTAPAAPETTSAQPEPESEKEDEWSNWASAMLGSKTPAEPQKKMPSMLDQTASARFAALAGQQDEPPPSQGLTDLFGKPDDSSEDELTALFENSAGTSGDDDPMAWLRDTGVQLVDEDEQEPTYDSLFAADAEDNSPLPQMDENPMAWLQDSDSDLIIETPAQQPPADDDPFTWMQDTGEDKVVEVQPQPSSASSSPDWMQNDQLLDEALSFENLSNNTSSPPDAQEDGAWLSSALGDEGGANTPESVPENVPGPRRGLTSMLQEANFDWINKQAEEPVVSDTEMDEWLNQFGGTGADSKAATETPDWLSDTGLEEPGEAQFNVDTVGNEVSGMSSENTDDNDWLTQPEAAQPGNNDNDFAWMSDAPVAGDEAATTETPDWLTLLGPEAETDGSTLEAGAPALQTQPEADGMSDWLSELDNAASELELEPEPDTQADDVELDNAWMKDTSPVQAEPIAANDEEEVDWLAALDPQRAISEAEPEISSALTNDSEFTWLTEVEAEPEAAATESVPDWLSSIEPEKVAGMPEPQAEPITDSEFTWLSEDALSEPEPESAASTEGVPDWLAELEPEPATNAPEPQADAVSDSEFTWMTEESLANAEAEAAVAGDTPDWLSELAPEAASESEPQAEGSAQSEYAWLTEEAPGEESAVAENVPDWLSELEPEQVASEPEPQPEAGNGEFTWMTEESLDNSESEAAIAGDTPDWLSELAPQEESAGELEPEPEAAATGSTPDWLSEITSQEESADEPEPEPVTEGTGEEFDLQEEPQGDQEFEPAAEAVPEAVVDNEQADVAVAEEDASGEAWEEPAPEGEGVLEPTPAQNAPDWLNAMVPGLDVDYEAEDELEPEEDEVVDEREFAWVVEMVEDEATARSSFVFSRPPAWAAPSNSVTGNGDVDDGLPDWPSDDADADVPEWLR